MPQNHKPADSPSSSATALRWRRVSLFVVGGLVAVLAAALVWLFTADLGVLKPQIEKFAGAQLGRHLGIEGQLHITLGEEALLIAEGVSLQNAEWAGVEPLLEVDRVELRLDLRSLFRGPIVLRLVSIDGVTVRLARDEALVGNWELEGLRPTEVDDEAGPGKPFDFLVREVAIDDLALSFSSPERPVELRANIVNLHQSLGADGFLDASITGTINDRKLALEGRYGTWQALLSGKNVGFDFRATADTVSFFLEGRVDDLLRPHRPSARFEIRGADLGEFKRMFGIDDGTEGSLDVEGELVPLDGGPLRLSVLGKVGVSEIRASGSFSNLQDFEDVELELTASGPDLGELLRLARIDHARDAPFVIDLDATRHGSVLEVDRADIQLARSRGSLSARMPNFPSFDDASVRLSLQGADIENFRRLTGIPGAATGPFSLDLEVVSTPAGVELATLEVSTELVDLRASGELGAPPRYAGSRLDLHVRSEDLARIGNAWRVPNLPSRPVEADGRIELQADGIRAIGPVTVGMNGVTAAIEGTWRYAGGVEGRELAVSLAGPDLAGFVNEFRSVSPLPALPFAVRGKVGIEKGGLRLDGIVGNLGRTAVNVEGQLALTRAAVGTSLAFSALGPAFEELMADIVAFDVRPGDFRLAGNLSIEADRLELDTVSLEREFGELNLDLAVSRSRDAPQVDFDIRTSGQDVRALLQGVEGYTADMLAFSGRARGRWTEGSLSLDRFELAVGDARASAEGTLDYRAGGSTTRFVTNGSIPSLARMGQLAGRRFTDQPLSWSARVTGGQGRLEVPELQLTVGESSVAGSVIYRVGEIPTLDVVLESPSLVVQPLRDPDEPEETEPEETESARPDGRIIPDVAIPFDRLAALDGSLQLGFGEFRRGDLALSNLEVAATLRGGELNVSRLGFDAPAGRLDADLLLGPAAGAGRLSMNLVARELALGINEANRSLQLRTSLDVQLSSTGADLRTLAGNANGVVILDARGGQFENKGLARMYFGSLLEELLVTLNPFMKTDEYTTLDCLIVPFEIRDGKASSVPNSLLRTNKIEIATHGEVDLKTEKLSISVRTVPRKGVVISAAEIVNPYFKLVGTLAEPTLAVDEQGVLITGGAAVATGGISILAKAVWDRISRAPDPCADTSGRAREQLAARWPSLELSP
ncbi:MAG: AsmA family protein [Gammaproteobacteria bacterium]|nr:AsmA family protein [Gammaproteobacteria bacterium]MDH4254161.1 AsmA family protein [Gammaproteobacteria bacterium]MDH5309955.1 AsmA family protein [Gammaproteobacteria bacterium]